MPSSTPFYLHTCVPLITIPLFLQQNLKSLFKFAFKERVLEYKYVLYKFMNVYYTIFLFCKHRIVLYKLLFVLIDISYFFYPLTTTRILSFYNHICFIYFLSILPLYFPALFLNSKLKCFWFIYTFIRFCS